MDKLGIQLPLLLAQIVNFGILVFILTKFLYKPVQKQLEERRQKIAAGLALTESLQAKEAQIAQKETEVIKAAKAEGQKIIAAAKKAAQKDKEAVLAGAKEEIAREREKLASEMAAQLAVSRRQLTSETVDIAQNMAVSILGDVLDTAAQHQLIAKSIAKLTKDHGRK